MLQWEARLGSSFCRHTGRLICFNKPDREPGTVWTDGGPRPRKKVEGLRIGRTISRGIVSWQLVNTHTNPPTSKKVRDRDTAVALYEEWAQQLREEGKGFCLTPSERAALSAWRNFQKTRLAAGEPVLPLDKAIQLLIRYQEQMDVSSPLISEAANEYINSLERNQRSSQHIASTRSMLKLALSCFPEGTRMADVDEDAAADCLKHTYNEASRLNSKKNGSISANTFHHYYIALSGLWAWAVDRHDAPDNPFKPAWKEIGRALTPERLQPGKEYTTPESLKKMLDWTLANHPEMVPGLAVLAFAGLRPTEIFRLKWSDIVIDPANGSTVHTTDIKRKTGYARIVDLCPAAVEWIQKAWERTGKPDNIHVIPGADDDDTEMGDDIRTEAFRRVRARILQHCPPEILPKGREHKPWPQDLLRHSFGTYHRARTGSLTKTADQMGNKPDICNKHYATAVPKAAGDAWFNVMPDEEAI